MSGEEKHVEDLDKIIVVGDRVLIKPKSLDQRTQSGLYLPPGIQEKENVQSGYVIKIGPGYAIPIPVEDDEKWKEKSEQIKYMPLQATEGDLAIYLFRQAYEIEINKEKYMIIPHSAILMLYRDDGLFD